MASYPVSRILIFLTGYINGSLVYPGREKAVLRTLIGA